MQLLQEQYSTVQNYVCSLFDSLPKIFLPSQKDPQKLIEKCIEQNMQYGRKIIELSEKFTSKYRTDHFVQRKDIEIKIREIYKLLAVGVEIHLKSSMDEMVDFIYSQICKQKHLKEALLADSQKGERRINTTLSDNKQLHRVPLSALLSQEKQQSRIGNSRKVSHGSKQKPAKKDQSITTKRLLSIKGLFEQQQAEIRQVYQKIQKLTEANRIQLSEEKTKFTKIKNDNESDNMMAFVTTNVHNNCHNVRNIRDLFVMVVEGFSKKAQKEGMAESRFNMYRQEIEKREDTYSYAVSKMLENINNIRVSLGNQEYQGCLKQLNNLEAIGQTFYELYPSDKIIKDLRAQRIIYEGRKNQAVQVTMSKAERSNTSTSEIKKTQIESYKMAIKMNEFIDHFEKCVKHKKQIQGKEVERLLESMRQLIPKRSLQTSNMSSGSNSIHTNSAPYSELSSFQQEIKRIIQINQKHQKDIQQDYCKKNRKLQRKVGELQKTLEESIVEMNNFRQQKQSEKKKLQRKLQQEKQQTRKMKTHRQRLEKNLSELIQETNRLRKLIKNEKQASQEEFKKLVEQNDRAASALHESKQRVNELQKLVEGQKQRIAEQRRVYKQKIVILETHQEQNQLNSHKSHEDLIEMLKQNESLKKQMEEFSELYEQKIRQVQQMIQDIKKLQQDLHERSLQVQQLQERETLHQQIIHSHQQQLQKMVLQSQELKQQLSNATKQTAKYKEIGILNEEDIGLLKQQMEKVKSAYMESDQQLQQVRSYCQQLQNEKARVYRDRSRLNKALQEMESHLQNQRTSKQKLQKEARQYQSEITAKEKQVTERSKEAEEYKRECLKFRKQCTELREAIIKLEHENREMRQESQRKKQHEGLQNGKKKLQFEAMKVELRRKTEQSQRQKQQHLEETQTLQQKNTELQQLIAQKQTLMRIASQHMTN